MNLCFNDSDADFLYEKEETSSFNEQTIQTTITNKLLYQWFGNILIIDHWHELWLMHSFTKFFSYKVLTELNSDNMQLDEQFNIHVIQKSLNLDSSKDSRALVYVDPSATPQYLRETFYNEVYALKGASILKWIEYLVGEPKFQEGMIEYVNDG